MQLSRSILTAALALATLGAATLPGMADPDHDHDRDARARHHGHAYAYGHRHNNHARYASNYYRDRDDRNRGNHYGNHPKQNWNWNRQANRNWQNRDRDNH